MHHSIGMWVFFLCFLLITAFTILNMLVGVMCAIVTSTADEEKGRDITEQARTILIHIFETMDLNDSGMLDETEYRLGIQNDKVQAVLQAIDVDITPRRAGPLKDLFFHRDANFEVS